MSWDRILATGIACCAMILLTYVLVGDFKLQIDLGNLAVGLGTMAVAYVTNKASLAQKRTDSAATLANFRLQWSENVRECASNIIASSRNLQYINGPKKGILTENNAISAAKYADEIGECLSEIQKYTTKLRLLMQFQKHNEIIIVAEKISALSFLGKADEVNILIVQFSSLLEEVLERSWNTAKTPLIQ